MKKALFTLITCTVCAAAFAQPVTPVTAESLAQPAQELAVPADTQAIPADTNALPAQQLSLPVEISKEETEPQLPTNEAKTPTEVSDKAPVKQAQDIARPAEETAAQADTLAVTADSEAVTAETAATEKTIKLVIMRVPLPEGGERAFFIAGKTALCAAKLTKDGYIPSCTVPDGEYRVVGGNGRELATVCYAKSKPVECGGSRK